MRLGDVTHLRDATTRAFSAYLPDADVNRCIEIARFYFATAGPGQEFPRDRSTPENLLRHWSAVEKAAVLAEAIPPLDADGRPQRTWRDDCCDRGHNPLCRSLSDCRKRSEREEYEAEIAAAGAECPDPRCPYWQGPQPLALEMSIQLDQMYASSREPRKVRES